MKNLAAVDEEQSVQQLVHDFLDLAQAELDVRVAEEAGEVMLAEFKHQEEGTFEAIVRCC